MQAIRTWCAIAAAVCCLVAVHAAVRALAAEPGIPLLRRVQTTALAGPPGRLDHLALDPIHHRAGQSTRQVSFPPPCIGTVPLEPHAHS